MVWVYLIYLIMYTCNLYMCHILYYACITGVQVLQVYNKIKIIIIKRPVLCRKRIQCITFIGTIN